MKSYKLLLLTAVAILSACGGGATEEPGEIVQTVQQAEASVQPLAVLRPAGAAGSIGQTPSYTRARYGFTNFVTPSQQGSGQVIAIISAYNNPNAGADLQKFSEKYGLPQCEIRKTEYLFVGTTPTAQVVKPRPGDGCTFQVVNLDSVGRPNFGPRGCEIWGGVDPFTKQKMCLKAKYAEIVPQVDMSGSWVAESSMDVQWAHAIAPMASIVLIQAPNNFVSALAYATKYASTVANVVSMSWGANESSFKIDCPKFGKVDPSCTTYGRTTQALYGPAGPGTAGGWDTIAFSNPAVTYVAASGDRGNITMWPAVSNRVLSVGATNNSGVVDNAWSGSGGGLAAYYPAPHFQSALGYATRAVPDVAYNGDIATPFAVYITPANWMPDTACVKKLGASNCGWYGGYGTSLGAPQWAGMIAIARAMRAEQFKSNIDYLSALYSIASNPAAYSMGFGDVVSGSNGYNAGVGYDLVTGLGVPKAQNLVNMLVGL